MQSNQGTENNRMVFIYLFTVLLVGTLQHKAIKRIPLEEIFKAVDIQISHVQLMKAVFVVTLW